MVNAEEAEGKNNMTEKQSTMIKDALKLLCK